MVCGYGYGAAPESLQLLTLAGIGASLTGIMDRAVDTIAQLEVGICIREPPTVTITNATGDTTGSGAAATATIRISSCICYFRQLKVWDIETFQP